jgi:hypothetical protein
LAVALATVVRELVPAETAPLGSEFTVVEPPLTGGLPALIPLGDELTAALVLPTGLAKTWRDADPTALVTSGDEQTAPASAPAVQRMRAPARLVVERQDETIATLPLIVGVPRRVSEGGRESLGAVAEIVILGWEIRAGSLQGPGDAGSWIRLAWRERTSAEDEFGVAAQEPVA